MPTNRKKTPLEEFIEFSATLFQQIIHDDIIVAGTLGIILGILAVVVFIVYG